VSNVKDYEAKNKINIYLSAEDDFFWSSFA